LFVCLFGVSLSLSKTQFPIQTKKLITQNLFCQPSP
jgi:hypothetical protein